MNAVFGLRGRRAATMSVLTVALAGVGAGVAHAATGGAAHPALSGGPRRPGRPPRAPLPGGGPVGSDGLVTTVDSSAFTVDLFDGTARTFQRTSSTQVRTAPPGTSTGATLMKGEHVLVTVVPSTAQSSTPTAATVTVLPARVSGIVTAVSGDTVMVFDRNGFTRTVRLGSATVFSGLARGELAAGKAIVATGTVASDGTTLDAGRITAPPARPVPPLPPRPATR